MRILPHLIAVLHVPLIAISALLGGSLAGAAYAGYATALGTDPIVLVAAFLIGGAASRWWQVLLATAVASAAIHLFIISTNEFATGSPISFAARASGMATLAYAVNVLRITIEAVARTVTASRNRARG